MRFADLLIFAFLTLIYRSEKENRSYKRRAQSCLEWGKCFQNTLFFRLESDLVIKSCALVSVAVDFLYFNLLLIIKIVFIGHSFSFYILIFFRFFCRNSNGIWPASHWLQLTTSLSMLKTGKESAETGKYRVSTCLHLAAVCFCFLFFLSFPTFSGLNDILTSQKLFKQLINFPWYKMKAEVSICVLKMLKEKGQF